VGGLERAVQGQQIAAVGHVADDLEQLADAGGVRVEIGDAGGGLIRILPVSLGVAQHLLHGLGDVGGRSGERLHRGRHLAHPLACCEAAASCS
jgi:hypothetical protein